MTTRSLPAVGGAGREASVAFAANLLIAIVLRGQDLERGFDDSATKPKYCKR